MLVGNGSSQVGVCIIEWVWNRVKSSMCSQWIYPGYTEVKQTNKHTQLAGWPGQTFSLNLNFCDIYRDMNLSRFCHTVTYAYIYLTVALGEQYICLSACEAVLSVWHYIKKMECTHILYHGTAFWHLTQKCKANQVFLTWMWRGCCDGSRCWEAALWKMLREMHGIIIIWKTKLRQCNALLPF